MDRRVTIRDIAAAAGYHYSTVSLALRNAPSIPAATRKKIQKTAEALCYTPDPVIMALSAYRTAIRPVGERGTLAWLSNESVPVLGRRTNRFFRYSDSAQARAAELGYRLEEFNLRAPGMNPSRMAGILEARGISGILVAPQPRDRVRARIRMDWSRFSAVAIGHSLAWPALHLVANNQFATTQTAYRKLNSLGYRRIGLGIERIVDGRSNHAFLGGYLTEMWQWPPPVHLEPLLYDSWDAEKFRRWFHKWKPEAIIMQNPGHLEMAVATLGLRVPGDLGVVLCSESSKGIACVDQHSDEIGRAAVNFLVSLIRTNERGIPSVPHHVLIKGTWQSGGTVRRIENTHFMAKTFAATRRGTTRRAAHSTR